MCGIVGIIQKTETRIGEQIIDSLTKLEYRGYDSVGIAAIKNGELSIVKDQGKIKEVVEQTQIRNIYGTIAIGHTRWATHGKPNQKNSHPHTDSNNKIAVVHNGIVENFQELKQELIENGHSFKSDTDTEVIPHLIEYTMEKKGLSFEKAVLAALNRIEGAFAVAIISTHEPNHIYCAKKDSPLVIGVNDERMFIASDIPAFLTHTQHVILLRDNEFTKISTDSYQIINLHNNQVIKRKPYTVSWKPEMAQKGGFPHFMLKEIHEQPNVLSNYIRIKQPTVNKIASKINEVDKIFFLAAGTAYHSTLTGEYLIRKHGKKLAQSIVASEYEIIEPLIDDNTALIAVSQSGETMDTIQALKAAQKKNATIMSTINVVGSTITRYSEDVVYIHAGPEIGVAATKTYINQTLAMWDIGIELGKITGNLLDSEYKKLRKKFNEIPNFVSEIIRDNEVKTKQIATWFAKKNSSFYLGRGINVQTAMEGALKMKEISYIHCEAYPAGESKHGPIALIEDDYPVVFVAPNDASNNKIIGNIMEMKARGGKIIATIEKGDKKMKELADWTLEIPKGYSKTFSTIGYVVPLQLLSYYTAVKRGYDPDKPRNLAKSVTVI